MKLGIQLERSSLEPWVTVMKSVSDEQLAPKGDIGGFSSNWENNFPEKGVYELVVIARKSLSTTVPERLHEMKVITPGWRTVEVAASFHQTGMPSGGGFLLRELTSIQTALLAEAFTLEGESALFAEASALRNAMLETYFSGLKINKTRGVAFLFESAELVECLTAEQPPQDNVIGPIIQHCRNLLRVFAGQFGFKKWPGEDLAAANWLAEHGRICCKPQCWWDINGQWPPELAELLDPAETL